MFEECFSMIELNGLLENAPVKPEPQTDEGLLFHHLTHAVLKALEKALLDADDSASPVH